MKCGATLLPPDVLSEQSRSCDGIMELVPNFLGKGKHLYRCTKHARLVEQMNPALRGRFVTLATYKQNPAGYPTPEPVADSNGVTPTEWKGIVTEASLNPKSLTSRTNKTTRKPRGSLRRTRAADDDGPDSLRDLLKW